MLMVLSLVLRGWPVAERLEQPRGIEPRHPFERRELQIVQPALGVADGEIRRAAVRCGGRGRRPPPARRGPDPARRARGPCASTRARQPTCAARRPRSRTRRRPRRATWPRTGSRRPRARRGAPRESPLHQAARPHGGEVGHRRADMAPAHGAAEPRSPAARIRRSTVQRSTVSPSRWRWRQILRAVEAAVRPRAPGAAARPARLFRPRSPFRTTPAAFRPSNRSSRGRAHRGPPRVVLRLVLVQQPHSPIADLGRELLRRCPRCRHARNRSGVGSSGNPGAVQSRELQIPPGTRVRARR